MAGILTFHVNPDDSSSIMEAIRQLYLALGEKDKSLVTYRRLQAFALDQGYTNDNTAGAYTFLKEALILRWKHLHRYAGPEAGVTLAFNAYRADYGLQPYENGIYPWEIDATCVQRALDRNGRATVSKQLVWLYLAPLGIMPPDA